MKTWSEHHVGAWQDVAQEYKLTTDEDIDRAVTRAVDTLFGESKVLALDLAAGEQRHIPVHAIEWVDIETQEAETEEAESAQFAAGSTDSYASQAEASTSAAVVP